MSNEQRKIEAMRAEGTISDADAEELLAALGEESQPLDAPSPDYAWPEMPVRGKAWQRPFTISLVSATFGSTLLWRTRHATGLMRLLHIFLLWPLTLFAAVAALVTYFSKESPWLHVRVRSADGSTFAISLPFPAQALNKALELAREQAPDPDVREKIDAAAEALAELDTSELKDPVVIDISDKGDSVQIFLN